MATGVPNFIPTLWAEKILREKDKTHMLVKNCTREWSGKIEGVGSKVKINSIDYPTVNTYTLNTAITLEQPKDESRMLEITQADYFNVALDDVDKKQATKGIMEEVIRKGAIALMDAQEAYVGGLYTDAGNTVTDASVTSADILSKLTTARRLLHQNFVTSSMEICCEVGPAIWEKIVLAGIVQTDTTDPLKGMYEGYWSKLLGIKFFVSNNLTSVVTSQDVVQENCLMRTKEAVAFAEQIMNVEKYRPPQNFQDAVKALSVYGAKVVKPREIVHLDLTTAAETTI